MHALIVMTSGFPFVYLKYSTLYSFLETKPSKMVGLHHLSAISSFSPFFYFSKVFDANNPHLDEHFWKNILLSIIF